MHAGRKFTGNQHMHHPDRLHGFPPIPGWIDRNPGTNFGDSLQFLFPPGIGFIRRLFLRQVSIPFGVGDGGIDGNQHRFIKIFLFLDTVMVIRLVYLCQIIFRFCFDALKTDTQHFLIIRHLVADISEHLPIDDIRDMRAGRSRGVSFFFADFIHFFQAIIEKQFLVLVIRDNHFADFFAFLRPDDMAVESTCLRIHYRVVHFFFQPAGGGAFDGRAAELAVDIADNQLIIADKNSFIFQVGLIKIGTLENPRLFVILIADFHLGADTFQTNFRRTDGILPQFFNSFRGFRDEKFLPAADGFCVFVTCCDCHFCASP